MTRLGGGLLLTVAVTSMALTGCSPSVDDVNDAVADLPGVISAEPSCHEFLCTIQIEAESDASASELADIIAAARTVDDVWTIHVSVAPAEPKRMSVTATLDVAHSPASEDAAVGAILEWAAAEHGLFTLSVTNGTEDDFRVIGAAVADTSIWPLARAAWPLADELSGASLAITQHDHLRQQSLTARGSLPQRLVTVAEELQASESAVTGVLVENGRLLVGAISRDAAERLRPALADDPRLTSVATEVVVTTNVLLGATAAEPGTSQRLEPVLAVLDGQPQVLFATIQGNAIEVEVDDLRSAPRLVERVRRRAGAAFEDTVLVLEDPEAQHRVEITPDGDDAVLDLLVALLPTRGLSRMTAIQELEPDPARSEVSLLIEVRQPGPGNGSAPPLGPQVTRLARLLSTTPGTAASYAIGVTVEDSEGRSANAGWWVDRTPDGLVLGEVDGTVEQQEEVRAAWARGVG